MARGQPDFGALAPTETIVGISDLGELAARLGSPVTFDRRGNVIWFDDFESGINKWQKYYSAAGYAIEWSAEISRGGAFSCKISTATGDNKAAGIYHTLPFPRLSNVGLELSIYFKQYWRLMYIYHDFNDGAYSYYPRIKYNWNERKFYYRDEDGNFQEAGLEVNLLATEPGFHTIKLVIDMANRQYKRLIVNNQEVDLTGKEFEQDAWVEPPYLYHECYITNDSATKPAIAYVDDVIVTQNEP